MTIEDLKPSEEETKRATEFAFEKFRQMAGREMTASEGAKMASITNHLLTQMMMMINVDPTISTEVSVVSIAMAEYAFIQGCERYNRVLAAERAKQGKPN